MAREMVTVEHEDKENGRAVVPKSALKFMPGWSIVDESADEDGTPEGEPDSKTPSAVKPDAGTKTPPKEKA